MSDTKKKIILFDIDYTLFDTQKYKETLFPLLGQQIGIDNKEDAMKSGQAAIDYSREVIGHFDTQVFLKKLLTYAKKEATLSQLEEVLWNDDPYTSVLYDDVVSVLDTLAKDQDITIGILSTGERRLQEHKIKHLRRYFGKEHMHIFSNKIDNLGEVIKQYSGNDIYLIDDTLEVLCSAKQVNSAITTVLITQKDLTESVSNDCLPDKKIHQLRDILTIVQG